MYTKLADKDVPTEVGYLYDGKVLAPLYFPRGSVGDPLICSMP